MKYMSHMQRALSQFRHFIRQWTAGCPYFPFLFTLKEEEEYLKIANVLGNTQS
jgi:hypothetical protein